MYTHKYTHKHTHTHTHTHTHRDKENAKDLRGRYKLKVPLRKTKIQATPKGIETLLLRTHSERPIA